MAGRYWGHRTSKEACLTISLGLTTSLILKRTCEWHILFCGKIAIARHRWYYAVCCYRMQKLLRWLIWPYITAVIHLKLYRITGFRKAAGCQKWKHMDTYGVRTPEVFPCGEVFLRPLWRRKGLWLVLVTKIQYQILAKRIRCMFGAYVLW